MNKEDFFIVCVLVLLCMAIAGLQGYLYGLQQRNVDVSSCELRCYNALDLCNDFMMAQEQLCKIEIERCDK